MESQIGSGHSVFAVRGKYPFLGYDSIPRKSLWTASQLEHSTSKKIEKTYNCKLSKKKSETSLKPIFVFGKEKLAKLNKIEENGEKAKVAFIDDLGQKAIFAFNKDEKIKTLFEAVNSLIKPEENETKIGRFKLVSAMPRKLFGQLDHESRLSDFELFRNGNAALRIQF